MARVSGVATDVCSLHLCAYWDSWFNLSGTLLHGKGVNLFPFLRLILLSLSISHTYIPLTCSSVFLRGGRRSLLLVDEQWKSIATSTFTDWKAQAR
jgi:hypothetical protein